MNNLAMRLLRASLAVGGLACASMLPAAAQAQTLRGGGSAMTVLAWTGDNASALISPVSYSLLGAYVVAGNPGVTYCPTESEIAKNVLIGYPSNAASDTCFGRPSGFGGAGLTQPHFVTSGSPLTIAQFFAYRNHRNAKNPVQFPALAAAIAVTFNKSGVSNLYLTEAQVCRIFSGDIKTWQELRASGASTGIPAATLGNITVVYEEHASGSSFAFTNHLSAMCGASHLNLATAFQTSDDFGVGAAAYLANYAAQASATGDKDVVNVIATTDGTIGYADVTDVFVSSARYAQIENVNIPGTFIDPSIYSAAPLAVNIAWDKAIGPNVAGRPQLVSLPTTTQCLGVVDPSDYATPASGYPILGLDYMLGNAQGNQPQLTPVRRLLFAPWNATVRANTFTVGSNTGSTWLSNTGMTQSKVNGCILN
jgi:phosphate transport system substrate-binding protein